MTYEQFITLVRAMRSAQKDFFATRHGDDLQRSKTLELQVDNLLATGPQQRSLFDDAD